MTIKTLNSKTTNSAIARLLDVTEGAVRYHVGRMAADVVDGRSKQTFKAEGFAEAIELWRSHHTSPLNLGVLHEWLRTEHGYDGSVRSVQRRPSGRGGGGGQHPKIVNLGVALNRKTGCRLTATISRSARVRRRWH